jgi:NAD(P)H-dependent FMN reductase
MIVVISGTNRPNANTLEVARIVDRMLRDAGLESQLLDLGKLPDSLFSQSAYAEKPAEFEPFQRAILDADGIVTVVPEYNGSFPGALKYFIDMLSFPDSLVDKPTTFVGLSAGRWGAIRAVEQLKMVYQYRHAHVYGRCCYLPGISTLLDGDGGLTEPETEARLRDTVVGFASFTQTLNTSD